MAIFKNQNGKEYTVIKHDKTKDVALLVDITATIQPYIVAVGLKDNGDGTSYWCEGHYFSELECAEMCYNNRTR